MEVVFLGDISGSFYKNDFERLSAGPIRLLCVLFVYGPPSYYKPKTLFICFLLLFASCWMPNPLSFMCFLLLGIC